jgi:formylglycine-generating enzyme required for sulfatase activity
LVIIATHSLSGSAARRHHCDMGAGDWHWNDAWIFVSAVIAERLERDRALHAALPVTGASLADVLAAADFLHHSVPSRSELEEAVRRLAGAGLLTVDDDLVEVAPAGEQLWRTRPFSGLSSAVVTLQTQLNRAATPGESDWKLDEKTYNAAVREYSLRLADGR